MFGADKLFASGGGWLDLRSMRERLGMVDSRFGAYKGDTISAQIPFVKRQAEARMAEYSVESKLAGL